MCSPPDAAHLHACSAPHCMIPQSCRLCRAVAPAHAPQSPPTSPPPLQRAAPALRGLPQGGGTGVPGRTPPGGAAGISVAGLRAAVGRGAGGGCLLGAACTAAGAWGAMQLAGWVLRRACAAGVTHVGRMWCMCVHTRQLLVPVSVPFANAPGPSCSRALLPHMRAAATRSHASPRSHRDRSPHRGTC